MNATETIAALFEGKSDLEVAELTEAFANHPALTAYNSEQALADIIKDMRHDLDDERCEYTGRWVPIEREPVRRVERHGGEL